MISGRLAASVDARHDGDDALVGPTETARSKNGPYGRFLELGGEHVAHNDTGEMWWFEDGRWHHKVAVIKVPRPYLMPATLESIASGEITDAYARRWLVAQNTVAP